MESHKIEELIAKLSNDDPFTKARSELKSERKRLQYVKESFDYTPPETGETYQFVPIVKTLKVLLEDQTYLKQKEDDPYFPEDAVYKDVRDGEFFKTNKFFIDNPEAEAILIFQDELELSNPLGILHNL